MIQFLCILMPIFYRQAVIHLRMKVKICWAQDIVARMGVNFGRTFLEQEVSLDAESIVAEHTYKVNKRAVRRNHNSFTSIDVWYFARSV